ncbi:hypothetical protein M408DRAFT_30031 [Serendipita vermifera MAFF 305830]|uniref:Mid2 domain-containing protein n=1 Tax=Serendipita vermifera MAFF 305830 TaxID=933852 RepID=A0A0C2W2Y7_SERVB|nr:hypothetical protein M408DRAFT_30031 [Serendipita vermifera MAFF 305830]
MRPLQHFTFLFCAFIDLVIAQTLTNITIDDNDSSISYIGTWEPASGHLSSRDYGGSHTVSVDTAGSATFTFTGTSITTSLDPRVAVYYLAPKWPYQVDNYIALDGGTPQLVDMTVPATPRDPPKWRRECYAIVDGFIYTTPSDPNTSTGSTNSSSSNGGSSNKTVIIAVSVSAAVVGLVLLVGLIVFFVRRRNRTERDTPAYGGGGGGGGGGGVYNIPANNHPDTPHSAVSLNAYVYPSGGNNTGHGTNGPEMSMANIGYYPENQPGGFNAAAAYAIAGPTTSADKRPNQSPSPVSGKAHYRGMSREEPSIASSMQDQNSGFDSPSPAHPYGGTSSPPPYAA